MIKKKGSNRTAPRKLKKRQHVDTVVTGHRSGTITFTEVDDEIERTPVVTFKAFGATGRDLIEELDKVKMRDMYNVLNEYAETVPITKISLHRALRYLRQTMPFVLVSDFFKYMLENELISIPEALARYTDTARYREAISRKENEIKKRKAVSSKISDDIRPMIPNPFVRSEPYKYVPDLNPSLSYFKRVSSERENCIDTFEQVPWASEVVKKPVKGVAIVAKKQDGMQAWTVGEEIRGGWYNIDKKWIVQSCYFGRKWRPDTIGYMLEDGKILEESRSLFDASFAYFRKNKPIIKNNLCSTDYSTAPWAIDVVGPVKRIVGSNQSPKMERWLDRSIGNNSKWYTLKSTWFDDVCKNGREWIPGGIGYELDNGVNETTIIPESKSLYLMSMSVPDKVQSSYSGEIQDMCVINMKEAKWVSKALGNVPGSRVKSMLTKATPEMMTWIPVVNGKMIPLRDEWYRIKDSWYKHVCKHGRERGEFAYLLVDGNIVPETDEIYRAYLDRKESWDYSDIPPTRDSFIVAKSYLMMRYPEKFVNEYIKFLPTTTNMDIAKVVARALVYSTKLIKSNQIHLTRLERNQYTPEVLSRLRKEELLPEVFKNPSLENKTFISDEIKRRQKTIVRDFMDSIHDTQSGKIVKRNRRSYTISKLTPMELDPPDTVEQCSNDPVYYLEDDIMYCFDHESIKGTSNNPITEEPFSTRFLWLVNNLNSPDEPIIDTVMEEESVDYVPPTKKRIAHSTSQINIDVRRGKKRKTNTVLKRDVQGLWEKLDSYINNLTISDAPQTYGFEGKNSWETLVSHINTFNLNNCANCNDKIKDTSYTSVYNGKELGFCGSDCLDDYEFI